MNPKILPNLYGTNSLEHCHHLESAAHSRATHSYIMQYDNEMEKETL